MQRFSDERQFLCAAGVSHSIQPFFSKTEVGVSYSIKLSLLPKTANVGTQKNPRLSSQVSLDSLLVFEIWFE